MEHIPSYYASEMKWGLDLSFQNFVCIKILHDAGYKLKDIYYKVDNCGTNYDMVPYILKTIFGKDNIKVYEFKKDSDEREVYTIKVDLANLSDKEIKELQEKADEVKENVSSSGWAEDVIEHFKVTKKRLTLRVYPNYITSELAKEMVSFAKLLKEKRGDAHVRKNNQDKRTQ